MLYAKGYGFADVEKRIEVRADTGFLVASITKMFTAIATLQLARDDKVELDQPIARYVSGLPPHWKLVTVCQLLTHTGGINSYSGYDRPPCLPAKPEASYAPGDVLGEIACLPLDFAPGSGTALYGMGFAARPIDGRALIGHTGGGPGASTSFARFTDDDLSVIILTNTAQRPFTIQELVGGVAAAWPKRHRD